MAQRSAQSSKDIKALIVDSDNQVKEGVQLVEAAGKSLEEILGAIKEVNDLAEQIAAASAEQASGIDQINAAVTEMDEVTQKNAALVEESTAAARSMEEQSHTLNDLVSFFKMDGMENVSAMPASKPKPAAPVSNGHAPSNGASSASASEPKAVEIPQHSADEDPDWKEF